MPAQTTIQTPQGLATVTRTLGLGVGCFPHFDSSMIEDHVERVLSALMPHLRDDATGTAAFARQLEHVFAKTYEIEYPALRATDFIPLNTEVPAGMATFTYRMFQKHGVARIINGNYAADLPNASITGKEWPSPIVTLGMSYEFDILSQQRAGITGVPLEAMLGSAARFAIEYLAEQIAAIGSPNDGVPGLTNAPGVTATTQLSTGTWVAQLNAIAGATSASPNTAVAAVQGIISDVNAMVNGISIATGGLYTPDTMLLPTTLAFALRGIPRSPAFTDDNILDYVEKMTGMDVDWWPQLNHAGANGYGRVMVYKKDPDVLQLIRPQPFTQLAPQARNLAWTVPCYSQEGGVMVTRPQAITYMDGLDHT